VDFLWQIIGGEPVRDTLTALAGTLAEMRSSVVLLEDSKRIVPLAIALTGFQFHDAHKPVLAKRGDLGIE
jgi:hypothetical protein